MSGHDRIGAVHMLCIWHPNFLGVYSYLQLAEAESNRHSAEAESRSHDFNYAAQLLRHVFT